MTQDDRTPEQKQREVWEGLLNDIAEKCLGQAPGETGRAAKLMAGEVRADPRLQDAILGMLLEQACADWVRRQYHARNQRIWYQDADVTQRSARLRSAGLARITFKMMDYTLAGGLRLGDATAKDLRRNAEMQNAQAMRMSQNALWFTMIAEELPDEETKVESAIGEQRLRDLQNSVLDYYHNPKAKAKAASNAE